MKVIDLTHVIHEDMQVFPGTEPPRLTVGNTLEKDGFRETALFLYSHTGTHMDTPAHMLEGAAELDKLPVSTFCGKAAVIPCLGGKITMEEINACRDMADRAEFIIFHTGQDALWGKEGYFDAPVPEVEVIQYAIDTGKKGVGIDCMSVDPMNWPMPNHFLLFNAGMVIVENLCNLDQASGKMVDFFALPLKYRDADGAPVRAIAILSE